MNTYLYANSNPIAWTDYFGLSVIGDTGDVIVCMMCHGIPGVWPPAQPADNEQDTENQQDDTKKQCDDDKCAELYKSVDIAVNGLQRRYRQIVENKGKIDPTTHQSQFRQRQVHLRKLLQQADTNGCTNYRSDAWQWASIQTPDPR